jgi:hypothetical protein
MFHAELFSSSIATGVTTPVQVNYVATDAILTAIINGVQASPSLPFVHSVMGIGAHLVAVRAQANSMLPFPYISINPNNRGSAAESPPRVLDLSSWPLALKPTEELDIFATQNATGSETEYILVQFCDGPPTPLPVQVNPPGIAAAPTTPGRFFTSHWTASTTLTAGAWTQVTPSFDQPLYAGYYALVGARTYSATALFFRMFPSYGPLWRPGGIAVQAYDQMDPQNQRYMNAFGAEPGGWGQWLQFYQNVPPKVEIFATSADTAEEGWFDLVYLGPQVQQGL